MHAKKILGAAAFSLALTGGGVAGAMLGSPGTSGAQATTTTAPSTGGTAAPDARRPGPRGGGAGLDAAAKAIGITTDDLRTALKGGKTIAAVAKAKGVDVQKVIDAMVAAESAEIDQRAADAKKNLPDRVKDQVNNTRPPGGPDGPGGRPGFGMGLDVAAKALGISTDDLKAALKDGKTLAAIAKEKGVDPQKVIDALVAEANTRIDQGVKDGHVTADQATERKAEAKTRITSLVNDGFKGGMGGPMGGGFPGGHHR